MSCHQLHFAWAMLRARPIYPDLRRNLEALSFGFTEAGDRQEAFQDDRRFFKTAGIVFYLWEFASDGRHNKRAQALFFA
jgi:hypothetical protein